MHSSTRPFLSVRFITLLVIGFVSIGVSLLVTPGSDAQTGQAKADPLKNLQFRLIGPFRGGRCGAVEGVASDPKVYYYGGTGGGVWKTTDAGVNWVNISDGFFKTATIGAIDAADSDPNIIYVGTGEETVRGNVQAGDGVYKSTDGGKT